MGSPSAPNQRTIQTRGWLHATRWLLMRRASQLSMLGLFLLGPLADVWIIKGNLSASLLLDTIPMTDPHLLLQAMLSGEMPVTSGLVGGLIILLFYAIVGGRVFCSWVCPVNMVTDAAAWLRRKLGVSSSSCISRKTRYWVLAATFVLAFSTGGIAWELINPVSMAHRGIIFGMGLAWLILLGVFLFDLLISKHGWCGRVCPVGAFYSLVGHKSLVRIAATARDRCDDCMDCFNVCPEPQVIKPALKGEAKGLGPVILDSDCTNCGRCIDVCDKDVFTFGTRTARAVTTRVIEQQATGRQEGATDLPNLILSIYKTVVENVMKRKMVSLIVALAAFGMTGTLVADSVQSLRGDDLKKMSAKPARMRLMEVQGGFERGYKEQPPLVPHEVDKYEVNLKLNGCMKCHGPETYEKEKSPKIGDSHFLDRDGKKLEKVSSRRYFCNQCHAPQLKGDPLVKNTFQGRK